jgi:hypothetical protein
MISKDQAREIVQAELDRMSAQTFGDLEFVLLDDATQEEPFGWVYFYDSRQHIESQDDSDVLAGNSPMLVLRESGEVRSLGTAYPTEHYLKPYR